MTLSRDNTHSWVRISHGLNKVVTNLNNNEQETSEMQFEEYALKINAGDFESRSKAKAKPQSRDSAGSSKRTIPIWKRTWTDVEPVEYSISDFEVLKKLIRLLRHGSLPRDDDGAIEFWRIENNLQTHFLYCHHWSDNKWKSSMTGGGGGNKKRFRYWPIRTSNSLSPSSSRSFRTQSHWSFITVQCIHSERLLRVHLSHRMCNQFEFHHEFRIDTRRTKFEKKTDSILSTCGSHGQESHGSWQDRLGSTASCTIHAQSMEETSKYGVLGRDQPCSEERIEAPSDYRTPSFFMKCSQLMVSRKLSGWNLEKPYTTKYMRHLVLLQRFPWHMTGWKNWVQKLLDNQREKLFNNPKVPNQANQIQTQIMIERRNPLFALKEEHPVLRKSKHVLFVKKLWIMMERGNPLFALKQEHPKHISLVTTRTSRWMMQQNTKERRNPLFAVMQITSAQCWTRLTSTSEYPDCHILLWNKLITIVYGNSWRRSRTTLTDNLFNEIYNKTKPTTRLVRRPTKWFRTWATWSCLNCSRQTPRRSAKNAYHIGVNAFSIASWKKVRPTEASSNTHWTFSQFQTTWLRRDDLMATDMGKPHNKKEYHQAHNLKKRCIKKGYQGIHDRFLIDSEFRASQLEHDRHEEVCIKMDELANKNFSRSRRKQNVFDTNRIGGSLSISLETLDHWEISLTSIKLQRSVVHIKPSTPRIWRTTTQAHAILEVSAMAPIIEFFLQLVAMEWFLVEFIIIQRKSINEDACKATW